MAATVRTTGTHNRLLLFKWLMVCIPPLTVAAGHVLLEYGVVLPRHGLGRHAASPTVTVLVILLVTALALLLSYLFAETMFRVLHKLQSEAVVREQDFLTMNAVMQERERLSRELHDGAAQLVAQLLLRLDTIKELVEEGRPREATVELERLHGVADEIYDEIGASITGLRVNVVERGLDCALRELLEQFEERHQIAVSLHTDNSADDLSPVAALQLFRFIQEALTNVRKHAAAREASITLTAQGSNRIKVVIADAGQGFGQAGQRTGALPPLGLTSMRERVEALGGTFQVRSQEGLGTCVTATVPLGRANRVEPGAALTNPAG